MYRKFHLLWLLMLLVLVGCNTPKEADSGVEETEPAFEAVLILYNPDGSIKENVYFNYDTTVKTDDG